MDDEDFKKTLWKAQINSVLRWILLNKHIVLGLIFLKYISDSFTEQKDKIKEMITNPDSDFFIGEDLSEIDEKV